MASVMTRVCVLAASYEESQGALKAVEGGYEVTPAHFFAPKWPPASHPDLSPDANPSKLSFDVLPVHKRTAYAQVREAVKSGKYDCFFNLCDGAKDEDRAGVEVVRALEEFGVAFTGSTSKHYEPTKDDMKKLVHYAGIRTPRGYVVRSPAQIQSKCASLRFPVIVKHASGYSSVGMTRLSKCEDMAALLSVASEFIEEYECALVEEFISGEEATVLACADPTAPGGVKVYPPVMMRFPKGEDFKHFDLKWNTFDDIAWYAMSPSHPAYQRVMEVGKVAFRQVMDGIGYGRSDVRIDAVTGDVVFLELNPNCGIMYPVRAGGQRRLDSSVRRRQRSGPSGLHLASSVRRDRAGRELAALLRGRARRRPRHVRARGHARHTPRAHRLRRRGPADAPLYARLHTAALESEGDASLLRECMADGLRSARLRRVG
jgi:D-alanine-D-alanine ligase-like ATP-grasp enzyme